MKTNLQELLRQSPEAALSAIGISAEPLPTVGFRDEFKNEILELKPLQRAKFENDRAKAINELNKGIQVILVGSILAEVIDEFVPLERRMAARTYAKQRLGVARQA